MTFLSRKEKTIGAPKEEHRTSAQALLAFLSRITDDDEVVTGQTEILQATHFAD
jgi:hypothetical protein